MKNSTLFIKMLSIVWLSVTMLGCDKSSVKAGKKFDTYKVVEKDLVDNIEINADIQVENIIDVVLPTRGRVEELYVKEGQVVERGQKLGYMSSNNRVNILDMAAHKGEAEIAYWEKQILPTYIFAPVSGKIISISLRPGDTSSGRLLELSKGLVIRGYVDEIDMPKLSSNQEVELVFDIHPDLTFKSSLIKTDQVSKKVSNVNVYEIEVSVPEEAMESGNVRPTIGMSVTVLFPTDVREKAKAIKAAAVNNQSNQVVELDVAGGEKIKVKLGKTYGEWVHVLSGAEVGQKIQVPVFSISGNKKKKSPFSILK